MCHTIGLKKENFVLKCNCCDRMIGKPVTIKNQHFLLSLNARIVEFHITKNKTRNYFVIHELDNPIYLPILKLPNNKEVPVMENCQVIQQIPPPNIVMMDKKENANTSNDDDCIFIDLRIDSPTEPEQKINIIQHDMNAIPSTSSGIIHNRSSPIMQMTTKDPVHPKQTVSFPKEMINENNQPTLVELMHYADDSPPPSAVLMGTDSTAPSNAMVIPIDSNNTTLHNPTSPQHTAISTNSETTDSLTDFSSFLGRRGVSIFPLPGLTNEEMDEMLTELVNGIPDFNVL